MLTGCNSTMWSLQNVLISLVNFNTILKLRDYVEKNCDCYIFKLRNMLGMDWNRMDMEWKDVKGRKLEGIKQLKLIWVKAKAVLVQCESLSQQWMTLVTIGTWVIENENSWIYDSHTCVKQLPTQCQWRLLRVVNAESYIQLYEKENE